MESKLKASHPDKDRINPEDNHEIREWADKFGVTHARLKAAVNTVGPSAKKVEAYLKKRQDK